MKWIPAVTLMLVTVISYIDRNTLALLAPAILRETHLSVAQYGWAVSAYSIAFMLANPLWGRILDRIGVRFGMLGGVSLWTLASVSHALAGSFAAFATARALLGLGEGAASPGGLRTVMQTLPATSRSRGIAMTFSGGSLGAILTPVLVTPVAAAYGWRGAFWFTGLLGLAWVALWLFVSRAVTAPPPVSITISSVPSFGDARLWSFMASYALGALPLGFVVYSASIYLSRALHFSQGSIGAVLWIPPLGSELGIFFWGWLLDRMVRRETPPIQAVRRLMPVATLLSLPLALVPHVAGAAPVLGEMFFAMFVASAFQILPVTYATQVFSTKHSGFLGGLASGSYGAGLAIFMPLFGKLYDMKRYDAAFLLAALIPALGYVTWRWVNRYSINSRS